MEIAKNRIRNFSIISHIDHGKSTLADRFLELTKTIAKEKMRPQYLDMMDLEREKGITIKMQPVRMEYQLSPDLQKIFNFQFSIFNLIDTPGHVDFSYEVSRSLAAVEGAILLVDAAKGIQAQTLANLKLAQEANLVIIPVVNKIDLPQAQIKETKEELSNLLKISQNEIFEISAKLGKGVEKLLEVVIEKIPPPKNNPEKSFKALIFDSQYDLHKGVIAYVRVFEGEIKKGEKIYLISQKAEGKIKELGFFNPKLKESEKLQAGEIGYIATGIKEPGKVRVGDTIIKFPISNFQFSMEPLPGYREPKPMVFASIYPVNPDDFEILKTALSKLKLNDPSLTLEMERKKNLGRGFRCGFLGSLHAEIVSERLGREFGLDLVISNPSVVYKIIDKKEREVLVYSPSDWPVPNQIAKIKEPWLKLEVITPQNFLGRILEILENLKGNYLETKYFSSEKILLVYEVPLRKVITGFYDQLKGVSQGFASMNYQVLDYRLADLVKLEILVAGKKEEAFSKIVSQSEVFEEGKRIIRKLKEILPSQLFALSLQAAISGKIIARETLSAKRRDVTAPLYGGDFTRKRKLLEKQKRGKKKLAEKGEVRISSKVYLEMFRD